MAAAGAFETLGRIYEGKLHLYTINRPLIHGKMYWPFFA
jgi:hypothetical protein